MAEEIIFPKVDMDMTEGKIAHWYVHNGDRVARGQVIFEIETDKATMEIEAAADGILQGSDGATGVTLPVGHVLGWIVQPGETVPGVTARAPATAATAVGPGQVADTVSGRTGEAGGTACAQAGGDGDMHAAPRSTAQETGHVPVSPGPGPDQADRPLRATPLARSIARAQGIDLRVVQGSGPSGRVLARDLGPHERTAAGVAAGAEAIALHLHWFNRRAGVPLVLLHGFATSAGSWRLLAEQLADRPVLGIDLPNHGKSARADVTDLDMVARSVLQRLDQEGVRALHLAGHSMGGGVALALAPLLGARLRSLTLIAPLGLGPEINGAFIDGLLRARSEASLRPWLRLLFADPARLTASFCATAWSELSAPDARDALAQMAQRLLPDGTQAESLRERLFELGVPLKLVWGSADRIVPVAQAEALGGAVALHRLPGVGHLPQIEAVPLLARLLRQQLAAGDGLVPGGAS